MATWPYNTTAWRRLRAAKLSAQPICEACERRGRTVLADAVDHVEEIRHGGDPFPPLSGLMSLCTACHSIKTNAVTAGRARLWKGCDVDGGSLDPNDDWSAPAPACGPNSGNAGAFAGRRSVALGPAGKSRKELVAFCNQSGEDLWV